MFKFYQINLIIHCYVQILCGSLTGGHSMAFKYVILLSITGIRGPFLLLYMQSLLCLFLHSISCWLQSKSVIKDCDSSSGSCSQLVPSSKGCRASVVVSVCGCVSSIQPGSVFFPLSSLLPVSDSEICVSFSSLLPVSDSDICTPLLRHDCLRMVFRCLLRRDWLQYRVRLRCHRLRECWASTLSWRAASRGWKLLM